METKQHWLTILVGLPRSGKSFWSEHSKTDEIVVSNDWIRENILGHSYSSASNAIVWTITDATIRILLGQKKNVILDGVNLTRQVRKFYTDVAKEYGAIVKMVVIDTPLEVCLKRNQEAAVHKLPDEDLLNMAAAFEKPTQHEYDAIEIVEYKP